ncbi:alkylmercury lyase family protein [Paraclostridium sp. AKS46]|nr:alkylmercury lyase family protein [Paraclostridium sp. AKS46]
MVVDDDGYINFIYPVSAHPTMHRVKLEDKREFNAMCAIDAMGWRCTFNQDIDIKSRCYVTGNEINISIKDGKVTSLNNPDLRVLHLNLDKHENWAANC